MTAHFVSLSDRRSGQFNKALDAKFRSASATNL